MATFKKTLSGDSRYSITLEVTETSYSTANNTSNISYSLKATKSSGSGYHTSNTNNPVKVKINGSYAVNTTKKYDFTGSTPKTITLASGTVSGILHNDDGTKTIACSGYFGDANNSLGSATASGNLTLTNIPRQSTLSTDEDAYNIGDTVSITMTKYVNTYKHTLGYTIDNNSYVLLDKQSNDTYSWSIPAVLANSITTNPPTKNITLYLRTYDGDKEIGTSQKTLAITVPINTYKPSVSISTPTEADATMISKNWKDSNNNPIFVQSKSKLSYSITNTKNRGANIISTTSTADGKSYTGTSVTTSVLTNSGTGTISASSTDTRGAVGTATKTYSVVAYSNPSITLSSAQRCLSNGTLDANGTYIKYSFKASISSVSGHNSGTYKLCYKTTSASTYTEVTLGTGTSINLTDVVSGFTISTDNEYDIKFTVTDAFTTIPVTQKLESGFDLMNFNASGKSMAIGKVSQATASEKKLEVALDTEFSGTVTGGTINFTSSNALDMLYGYISNILIGLFNSLGSSDALWDNLPKTTETGTNIELNNSIEAPIRIKLNASETTQNTTTGKNLLPNDLATKTINGITITKNNDGTYKVNGTATSDVSEAVCNNFIPMSGTWRMLGCPSGGSSSTYMLSAYVGYWGAGSPNIDTGSGTNITYTGNVKVRFYIKSGTTCNNLIFKPMLTIDTSTTINNWEPYTYGASPNPNYPQPIETTTGRNVIDVCGKNLANNNFEDYDITDGSYAILPIKLEYGKTYVLKATLVGEQKANYYNFGVVKDGTTYNNFVGLTLCVDYSTGTALQRTFTIDNTYTNPKLVCFIQKSQTKFNELFTNYHIQLEKSSTATAYEPYIGNSYEINLGKNLISTTATGSYTINGVTITTNNDGSVTLNGTSNSNYSSVYLTNGYWSSQTATSNGKFEIKSNTTYTLKGTNRDDVRFRIRNVTDSTNDSNTSNDYTFSYSSKKTINIMLYVFANKTYDNVTLYPQLEVGSTASSYSPYFEPIELCKIGTYQDRIFKSSGKNLLNKELFEPTTNATTLTILNNGIDINNTSNGFGATITINNLSKNTDYYLSYNWRDISNGQNKVYVFAGTTQTTTLSYLLNGSGFTFNTGENDTINIWFYAKTNGTAHVEYSSIMLNKGTSALPYEPYGNYWYKYNAVGKKVFDGSENWSSSTPSYSYVIYNPINDIYNKEYYSSQTVLPQVLSNYYTPQTWQNFVGGSTGLAMLYANNTLQLRLSSGETTIEAFKTWLSANKPIVYYILATPTYTQITNSELINQLEDLKNAHSYNKITNIMQENSELPFILEVDVIDLQNLT